MRKKGDKGAPTAKNFADAAKTANAMYGGMMEKKKGMMGGGKVYTSMDKKYGGGIFPRKGNM